MMNHQMGYSLCRINFLWVLNREIIIYLNSDIQPVKNQSCYYVLKAARNAKFLASLTSTNYCLERPQERIKITLIIQ
jgi:hypothetical protein